MTDAHVEATFEITEWNESEFDAGATLGRLTEALVSKMYSGGIEGRSLTKWLMAYEPDGTASFTGIERIRGSICGRVGSAVLLHSGEYADGVATATLRVLSGTDELGSLSGAGTCRADPAGTVTLDVDL